MEVDLWAWAQTKQKEKLGARLLNAQADHQAKKIMFEVPINEIKSEKGLEKILERMTFYYAKKSDSLAWAAFAKWLTSYRAKSESVDTYARKFFSLFAEIQTHDPEGKCSQRMLAMIMLLQLKCSKTDRAQILSSTIFEKDPTPLGIVHAVNSIFEEEGLPWIDKDEMKKPETAMLVEKSQSETMTPTWHTNGSLTLENANGDKQWYDAELAQTMHAFYGNPKGKDKRASTTKGGRPRHPKEGDGKTIRNGLDGKGYKMRCYDCESDVHLAGSPYFTHSEKSLFAGNELGYAGFAMDYTVAPHHF